MKQSIVLALIAMVLIACNKEEIAPATISETTSPTEASNPLGLLPHIGSFEPYNSTDPICAITPYQGNFDDNAIPVGQKVPDFTLYDKNNVSYNLESILNEGKPVFLMTGSYTCPVFRNAISELNQLISSYSNDINFYVAYTVEAHPDVDYSPYSDTVWTTQQNINEGVLYEQPDTYGERLAIVNDLTNAFTINCPILIDSPCNEFWYEYGEGPNRAYLIDTAGVVQISHGWFNLPTMINSIDAYLN